MAVLEESRLEPEPALNRRDEVAIGVFGTWMATGLFLDGWAHIQSKPESFLTPWHAVLYSGFGAALAYFTVEGRTRRRGGEARPIPPLMGVGLVVFGAGAVGDFLWHGIFGIERDLEALLSPTHLALLFGGVLMVTGPFRSAWERTDGSAPSFRRFFPTLVSITLATAVASFFTMYLSAFDVGGLFFDPGNIRFLQQIYGIAAVLTTNLVLITPTLFVLRRWRPPRGAFTILYGGVALAMVGMNSFEFPLLVIPALIGGGVADAAAGRLRAPWVGAIVPAVMWSSWFVAVEITSGVAWPAELVVGTVILATLQGAVLGVLATGLTSTALAHDEYGQGS